MSEALLQKLVDRLESVTKRLESLESKHGVAGGAAASAGSGADESGESVTDFDAIVAEHVAPWLEISAKLGGETAEIAPLYKTAVDELRGVLVGATAAKKPDASGMQSFLSGLSGAMGACVEYRNSHRGSKEWDHLSTVSEGVAAFGWVAVEPTPGPFATQTRAGAEFYSNKLLRLYKGKEEQQVSWANHFTGFLKGMEEYIKKHHRTGLAFTGTGEAKSAAGAGVTAAAAAAKPTPQAPPAPPKGAIAAAGKAAAKPSAAAASGALFAELNQGGKVTSHLKKVTRDMQTHKNTALRAGGVVKAGPEKKVTKHRGIPTGTAKGPVLEGNKWVVEFVVDGGDITIEPELKHSLYIYGCVNTNIHVKSKINQAQIDSSKKVSLVLQDVLATVDVVNSQSINMQVLGKSPTVSIEKTSGANVYLSKDGLQTEIITAKSDSVNVSVPHGADGDFKESPIAEQFISRVQEDGSIVTEPVDHSD